MPLTKITGGEFDNTQGGLSVAGIITASSDLLVSGNLGVGTIAPIVKLQVSTSGNTPIINQTTGGSTSYLMLQNTGGIGYVASNNNDIIIATSSNATETVRFTSSGRLGIGNASPGSQLAISGGTGFTHGIQMSASGWSYTNRIGVNGTSGDDLWISQNYNSSTNAVDSSSYGTNYIRLNTYNGTIDFGTNATNTLPLLRARIDSSGNFGIGITNPTEKTTINGNILLDYAISSNAYSEIRARYIGQNNCQSAIRFYNPNNAYDGAFTIWTQPNTLNASMVERMRIDGVGAIIKNQATREYNYSGFVANNAAITIDVPVIDDTNTGGGHKIWANHTHYNWSSYGAMIECWISSRATSITEQLNTHNITSANGGAWTVTKPNTTTLRISKSAGSYPGGGYYWVRVITNN
jgi:hypothetical protein